MKSMLLESRLIKCLSVVNSSNLLVPEIKHILKEENLDVNYFVERCLWHKVRPQVIFNVGYLRCKLGIDPKFFHAIEDLFLKNKPEVSDKEANALIFLQNVKAIKSINESVLFLKGSMLQPLYYQNTHAYRQMNDIDILCPTFSAYCAFLHALVSSGHKFPDGAKIQTALTIIPRDTAPLDLSSAIQSASAHCLPPNYPLNRTQKRIDLKFGTYFYLPVDRIEKNKQTIIFRDVTYSATSMIDEVVILLTHALDHTQARWGWLNDLYVMCKYGEPDWEPLLKELEKRGLSSLFYSWIDILSELYQDNDIAPARQSRTTPRADRFLELHRHWTLASIDHQTSPFFVFRVRAAIVQNSCKYRIAAWIVSGILFFKMLIDNLPRGISRLFEKIAELLVPARISFGRPIKLPRIYEISISKNSIMQNPTTRLKWNSNSGFTITHGQINFNQLA